MKLRAPSALREFLDSESAGGLVLIDTGIAGSAPGIFAAAHALGHAPSDLTAIVITHYHDDHRGSLAGLRMFQEQAHRLEEPPERAVVPLKLTQLLLAELQVVQVADLDRQVP